MRAVFVNHCHPEMDHVCAVRLRTFAGALADRGHQIVLLSGPLESGSAATSIADHKHGLAVHDWATPYVLPCNPMAAPLLERLHQGRLPGGIRQAVVVAGYLLRSGVFSHWRRGTQAALTLLADVFDPDVVWATFGNTDAWNIGRDLARRAHCPWVADLKDNWDHYIPGPFRDLLARRYGDAAHFTALSQGHADLVTSRFGVSASVIYSGFGAVRDIETPSSTDTVRMIAAGSIYDGQALGILIKGIEGWLDEAPTERPVEVCYFGNDHRLAGTLMAPLGGRCRVVVRPYLEPAELIPLLDAATVILSPRHPPMLYHHKFGDYVSTGRPVICLPGETVECRGIAEDLNASLFSCETAREVTRSLRTIVAGDYPRLDNSRLADYSWRAQAGHLEAVFNALTPT